MAHTGTTGPHNPTDRSTDVDIDTDAPLPPYEGHQTEAKPMKPQDETYKDGARTAGATGPVDDPEMKSQPKEDTPRGAAASPADEQPAADTTDGPDSVGGGTGPAHTPGTGRAEDKPKD
jgi:hypothetical protein